MSITSFFLRGAGSKTHYEYEVRINTIDERWTILRRYSRFRDLHIAMKARYRDKVSIKPCIQLIFSELRFFLTGLIDSFSVENSLFKQRSCSSIAKASVGIIFTQINRHLQMSSGLSVGLWRARYQSCLDKLFALFPERSFRKWKIRNIMMGGSVYTFVLIP